MVLLNTKIYLWKYVQIFYSMFYILYYFYDPPAEFGGTWETECLSFRFSPPTLLCARYSVEANLICFKALQCKPMYINTYLYSICNIQNLMAFTLPPTLPILCNNNRTRCHPTNTIRRRAYKCIAIEIQHVARAELHNQLYLTSLISLQR